MTYLRVNDDRLAVLLLLVLGFLMTNVAKYDLPILPKSYATSTLNRSSFPADFVFGTASSSYQHSSLCLRSHIFGFMVSFCSPRVRLMKMEEDLAFGTISPTCTQEDVGMMNDMGLDAYRFSISWPRILPQDEYGGFLSARAIDDYRDFVDICFDEFGDRIKHWITLNEPWTYSHHGYATGTFPPGRCSAWQQLNCTGGDSGTKPYLVAHHLLLAHAAAVKLYKEKYQGAIGITLVSQWFEPYSNSVKDRKAALRAFDFMLGWYLDPLVNGDYPYSMHSLVGGRLPKFSNEQSEVMKDSFDFIGMNYYGADYAQNAPQILIPSYTSDSCTNLTSEN
ncbi:hypothetical protein CRG98_019425 [Punica granatum]|uniref:Beta-glucosidase 12-like n=1 Tax=Punica granatum TaxID=22663 RepID=A0A2I0JV95_PUNGR|nr:hypothetical protein CRG98_019425 [Punica granatum]